MTAALLLLSLSVPAHADDLPLPDAPHRAPPRPIPTSPTGLLLPAPEPGGAFWAPHHLTRAFMYVEVVGAGMAVGGLVLMLADGDRSTVFNLGSTLLVGGGIVGLSATPGALITESVAFSRVPHANPAGLVLGWAGIGMVLISPLVAEGGGYDALPYMIVGGSAMAVFGAPVQFFEDEHAFVRVTLLPTPNGLALAGQW